MKPLLSIFLLVLSIANARAQTTPCDQAKSRQEVERLTAAGVIVSISQFPPYVIAVVDQRRWNRRPFNTKAVMARHIDCAIAGPDSVMLRTVIFRSKGDSQQLGVYFQNELKLP
jgi:hypothetical protein